MFWIRFNALKELNGAIRIPKPFFSSKITKLKSPYYRLNNLNHQIMTTKTFTLPFQILFSHTIDQNKLTIRSKVSALGSLMFPISFRKL